MEYASALALPLITANSNVSHIILGFIANKHFSGSVRKKASEMEAFSYDGRGDSKVADL